MRKLLVATMTAAAVLLACSPMGKAEAVTAAGAAIPSAARNFSPVHPAACQGWGALVPAGLCQGLRSLPMLVPSLLVRPN